jgi:hypothetical protein
MSCYWQDAIEGPDAPESLRQGNVGHTNVVRPENRWSRVVANAPEGPVRVAPQLLSTIDSLS